MFLRKSFAILLLVLFLTVSQAAFFVYALARTVFEPNFYSDRIVEGSYELVINTSANQLQENSNELMGFFTEDQLKSEIEKVFTYRIFEDVMDETAALIQQIKLNPEQNAKLSLKVLRESLLTVANNLVYQVYQKLPACADSSLIDLDMQKIPECLPQNIDYDVVVAPLLRSFEVAVYQGIPEELNEVNKIIPAALWNNLEMAQNLVFVFLLVLLALIALVLYKPISLIVNYLGWGFFLSGALGFLISLQSGWLVSMINLDFDISLKVEIMKYLNYIFSFIFLEIQRIALIFAIFGLALLLIKFILKKTVDSKTI